MRKHGVEICLGGGQKPWDPAENGYPPRSHDCMLDKTEFAEIYQEVQTDLERREQYRKTADYDDVEECSRPHLENATY